MTNEPSRVERPMRWALAGFGLAVLASPVMAWGVFADPPIWAAVLAAVLIALGMACWMVATILKARADRVSAIRLVGRALWAPIRFLLDFTF